MFLARGASKSKKQQSIQNSNLNWYFVFIQKKINLNTEDFFLLSCLDNSFCLKEKVGYIWYL